jgi:uncharacterized protein YqgQ
MNTIKLVFDNNIKFKKVTIAKGIKDLPATIKTHFNVYGYAFYYGKTEMHIYLNADELSRLRTHAIVEKYLKGKMGKIKEAIRRKKLSDL